MTFDRVSFRRTFALTTIIIAATALPVSDASAQGFFDFFFGGSRQQQERHAPVPRR